MSDFTTSPDGQDDSGNDNAAGGNWEARYVGLQRVVAQRDRDLAAAVAERDRLKAAQDAESADRVVFEEWKQAQAALDAEKAEREQYETLRAKFEPEPEQPPTPLKHNDKGATGWLPATDEPNAALRVDRSWP